jgi:hypothetical protein
MVGITMDDLRESALSKFLGWLVGKLGAPEL